MKDLNKVQLTGRLGKDPEIRHAATGTVVTNFSVASNRRWTDDSGEQQQETEWFSVVAFSKLAEICGEYLNKGSRVYIEGRLHTSSWEDADSGQRRYRTEVIASDLIMLDRRADTASGDDADLSAADEPEPATDRPASRRDGRTPPVPQRRARQRAQAADVL